MPASIFSETELATLHALRRFLFFAHEGKVQRRQADQQTNQVLCLNLVTNAIVTWNTVYMNAAIERLRAERRIGRDIDLGHLSPALYGHVNPYGILARFSGPSRGRFRHGYNLYLLAMIGQSFPRPKPRRTGAS